MSGLFAAARALEDVYGRLQREGATTGIRDRLMGFDDFNAIVRLDQKRALDAKFEPES